MQSSGTSFHTLASGNVRSNFVNAVVRSPTITMFNTKQKHSKFIVSVERRDRKRGEGETRSERELKARGQCTWRAVTRTRH